MSRELPREFAATEVPSGLAGARAFCGGCLVVGGPTAAYDPEFPKLFKVPVEFDDRMEREDGACDRYARLLGTLASREELRPLDRTGVARIIEETSRMVGDAAKLSTCFSRVADLVREADYWAERAGRDVVSADDVEQAVAAWRRRLDRLHQRELEEIRRGTILLDVQGERVGQVNGLSVLQLGQFAFGLPRRITARVRLGKGEVLDIEREVELGGPIHSKGVLILSGFLAGRYSIDRPLSLAASLVFEQSYGGVEGDSASLAETCALLSALADVPLRQDLAVTGSINQHGEVQAIGGVNEKIEGFFDLCHARGLTGTQGVLIPAANAQHLMLRGDVVDACNAGRFSVSTVASVDDALQALTGVAAGGRQADGNFPADSINGRVEARLLAYAQTRRAFAVRPAEGK